MSGESPVGHEDAFNSGPYDISRPPQWDQFPGLYPPLYTQTPDAFFDWVAPFLPEIELRVLIYLIRRTLGFKKQGDQVTIDQIAGGIVTREGARLDWGTQLGERSVQRALVGLEEKGLIERHRQMDPERGCRPSYIRLRLCNQSGADWQSRARAGSPGRGQAGHQGGAAPDTRGVSAQSPAPRPTRHRAGDRPITPRSQAKGVSADTHNKQIRRTTDLQETAHAPHTQETGTPDSAESYPDLWALIKEELGTVLAPSVYASRVQPTRQLAGANGTLRVACPDTQTARWLEGRLGRKVADIATLFADDPPRIEFVAAE